MVPVLSLLAGMLSGAWLWAVWLGRRKVVSKPVLPLPGLWPLRGRLIVSSHEKEVWHSLKSIFHDHAVMVKVPILRFTQLREPPMLKSARNSDAHNQRRLNSDEWLEMLGGLYSTFTICTLEGKVVGCVDVLGKPEGSKASRELKEALLLDCGIAYTVTSAFNVPDASTLRELFLGEIPDAPADQLATRGGDSDFHADMAAFTSQQAKLAG
ncbi:hypothetical protein [Polaromonas sp. CG9_12]|nr:hypothetical protein [Polaromonas sp. CG9_12]